MKLNTITAAALAVFALTFTSCEKKPAAATEDAYTFNYDYAGSSTTGNEAGNFLVVGLGWKGETPKGIKKVMHCETEFSVAIFRTLLFNPSSLYTSSRRFLLAFKL